MRTLVASVSSSPRSATDLARSSWPPISEIEEASCSAALATVATLEAVSCEPAAAVPMAPLACSDTAVMSSARARSPSVSPLSSLP